MIKCFFLTPTLLLPKKGILASCAELVHFPLTVLKGKLQIRVQCPSVPVCLIDHLMQTWQQFRGFLNAAWLEPTLLTLELFQDDMFQHGTIRLSSIRCKLESLRKASGPFCMTWSLQWKYNGNNITSCGTWSPTESNLSADTYTLLWQIVCHKTVSTLS